MMAAITSAKRTSRRGSRRIRLTAANRAGASRMMTAMLVISQSSGVLRLYEPPRRAMSSAVDSALTLPIASATAATAA